MDIKKFIIGGSLGMMFALVCVVIVWLYLQGVFIQQRDQLAKEIDTISTDTSTTTPASPEGAEPESVAQPIPDEPAGLPASELPLTEGQQQAVESLGINIDQVVITESVIQCARETLGVGRYEQILAGDTPSLLESAQLIPCLR